MTQAENRGRHRVRRIVSFAAGILGAYLIGRALAEPFTIDMSDPATYRNDWGGPHLLGVLAVHCGPGLLAASAVVIWMLRRALAGGRSR